MLTLLGELSIAGQMQVRYGLVHIMRLFSREVRTIKIYHYPILQRNYYVSLYLSIDMHLPV